MALFQRTKNSEFANRKGSSLRIVLLAS